MSYHTGANQMCQQKIELLFEYTKMHVKRLFYNIFFYTLYDDVRLF